MKLILNRPAVGPSTAPDDASIKREPSPPEEVPAALLARIEKLTQQNRGRADALRSRLQAVVDDRSLDRPVWERLAKNERPWRMSQATGQLRRDTFAALEAVLQAAVQPPSRFPPMKVKVRRVQALLRRTLKSLDDLNDDWLAATDELQAVRRAIGQALQTMTGPLLPATQKSKTAMRNWVALYLRDEILPVYFLRTHHAAVAALVNCAWPSNDGEKTMSPDDVRALKRGNP